VLCAHTHVPRFVSVSDGLVVLNPGSVGLPAYAHQLPIPHVMEVGSPEARLVLDSIWYNFYMAQRASIHDSVKQALVKDGWDITDDPYVITFGERFLFVDLGAEDHQKIVGNFIGATRANLRIAVEIKELRGQSVIVELEQAIGQYVLYRLLLNRIEPERTVYLAIPDKAYRELFTEPIGELVISDLPLRLLVVDIEQAEVKKWIPERPIEKS
jgi:hypothetical protein